MAKIETNPHALIAEGTGLDIFGFFRNRISRYAVKGET